MRPASQTNGAQSSKRAPAIQTEPIQTKGPVKQTAPSQTALMTRNLFIESYLDSNSKPQCSGATGNSSNG